MPSLTGRSARSRPREPYASVGVLSDVTHLSPDGEFCASRKLFGCGRPRWTCMPPASTVRLMGAGALLHVHVHAARLYIVYPSCRTSGGAASVWIE